MAIERSRRRRETEPTEDGILVDGDLRDHPPGAYDFWALAVDLALLPDHGCRFTSAELSIGFESDDATAELPIARRPRPAELAEQQLVVTERSTRLGASMGLAVLAELGTQRSERDEVTQTLVRLASFGGGTERAAGGSA